MKTKQKGLATVEFAIIGALFFVLLFGVIEFGRMLFVWSTLTEAARRGARVAAVCPVNHPAIARITVFNDESTDGGSPILAALNNGNVTIEYLDQSGSVIADTVGNFGDIRYVRVRITGYQHTLLIPFFNNVFNAPQAETTLPRESLGAVPDPDNPGSGATQCFGV